MAIERKKRPILAPTTKEVRLSIVFTSGGGNGTLTPTSGDQSLVKSITGSAGAYTLVLKQGGYQFVACDVEVVSAAPTIAGGIPLSYNAATNTCVFRTVANTLSAVQPADGDMITLLFVFRDSNGK